MSGPARLGDYELVSELGRGAMGVVYRAHDRRLHREVALKVLAGAQEDADAFLKEARAAARLRHPGIVVVYGADVIDGRRIVALELVDGGSLAERLERGGPLRARDAARLVSQLAEAVQTAHEQGVIHRDLKPANVLLEKKDGRPRLTDFGLARDRGIRGGTATGDIVGSPAYMAPEQARGENDLVGPWTDVWGLGAILYECLSGAPPHYGANVLEVLQRVAKLPVPSVDWARAKRGLEPLPRDLRTIVEKCLERNMLRRYRSAAALHEDLELWLEDKPILARPPGALERAFGAVRRNRGALALALAVALVATSAGVFVPGLVGRSQRRAEAVRLLERLGTGPADVQRDQAVYELTKEPATTPTAFLVETLEATTKKLVEARRVQLLTALEPRTDAERARQPKILGLAAAIDAVDAAPPEERVPQATTRILREARRRIGQRRAMEARALGLHPGGIIAHEQRKALAATEHLRALVAVEALGRVSCIEAGPALGRFLHACEDDEDALVVVTALGRLHEARAARTALRSYGRQGRGPTYWRLVVRSLALELGGKLPPFDARTPSELDDRALLRWELEDKKGALEDCARSIALDASRSEPWHMRGTFRIMDRDWSHALEDIERALAIDPDQADLQINHAFILSNRGETDRALAACARAIELDPLDPRAWNLRGYVRATLDPKAGLEDFDQAILQDRLYTEPWVNRSFAKLQLRDFHGAVEDASRAIELDPKAATSWSTRALAKDGLGDPPGALADLTRAIELEPKNTSFLVQRAHARFQTRDLDGALADTERVLELAPKTVTGLLLRGQIRFAKGDVTGARADVEGAVAAAPNYPDAWGSLGDFELSQQRFDAALAAYDRRIELLPEDGGGYASRARVRLAQGDLRGALADYEKATKGLTSASILVDYARALAIAGEAPRAREILDHALRVTPNEPILLRSRALLFSDMRRFDDAKADAQRALQADSLSPESHFVMGFVLRASGDKTGALREMRRAIEVAPPGADMAAARNAIEQLEKEAAPSSR